jgi:hypothetical protein
MKSISLFFLIICTSIQIKAQDTLIMRTGENIQAKVIEIGMSEVKYKKLDNLNGPIFVILKSDLLSIKYENGTKDDYSSIKKNEQKITAPNLFAQGQADAVENYVGYKIAGTTVLLSSFVPIVGPAVAIVPALLCYSSDPKDENLGYPDLNLMQNEQYALGYRQKAKAIKNKKIVSNFFTGLKYYLPNLIITYIIMIKASGGGSVAW